MILNFSHKQHIKGFGDGLSETKYARLGQRFATVGSITQSLTTGHTPSVKVFMSLQLMNAVWRLEIPSNEKFVLLALADHAKDEGVCWPGIPLLAKKCSLSERQIQRILKSLEKRKFINRNFRHGRSTSYQIVVTGMSPSAKDGVTLVSPPPVTDVTTDGDARVTQNRKLESSRNTAQQPALEVRAAVPTEEAIQQIEDKSLRVILERMNKIMQGRTGIA